MTDLERKAREAETHCGPGFAKLIRERAKKMEREREDEDSFRSADVFDMTHGRVPEVS